MEIIGEPLGEGSYGRVYKAVVDTLGEVAVKRLLVHSESNFLFSLREIEVGLKFDHPNLLKLREIRIRPATWGDCCPEGTRDDDLCLVYDLADCDLYALVDKEDIPEIRARNIISQLLLAVEYLHRNNYVHRDIRPANILRFPRDRIKLCDFGFCKKYHKYDEHDTNINAAYFRAPELFATNMRNGPPGDVWSIGCVMHYILSKDLVSDLLDDDDDIDRDYTRVEQMQALINKYPFDIDDSMIKTVELKKKKKNSVTKFIELYAAKLGNPKLYIDFLSKLLAFNPDTRASSTTMIAHPYMIKYVAVSIKTRESAKDLGDEYKLYEIMDGEHRERIKGPTIELFTTQRNRSEWYSDAAIFMAIDIYDRLLKRFESIRQMSSDNHSTYFRSCVYLASKYYTTHYTCNLGYETFPLQESTTLTLQCGKDFEDTILELLDYDLYRITLLDEYKKEQCPTTRTVMALLLFVMEGRHASLTPSDALALWKTDSLTYLEMSSKLLNTIISERARVKKV